MFIFSTFAFGGFTTLVGVAAVAGGVTVGFVSTGFGVSVGFGVATDRPDKGGLPSIDSKTGWLRDPQRFPIIIGLNDTDGSIQKKLRIGGQADIVVYTGTNGLLNALAAFRIRLNSWLSYVR